MVAATNVDVYEAVKAGKFREDLYYRLNTVPLRIPPLRDRQEDIHLLFRKFIADFTDKYRSPNVQLTEDAQQLLTNYAWPGNVRQLKNVAEQIAVLEKDRMLTAQTFKNYLPDEGGANLPMRIPQKASDDFSERDLLYKVLFDMKKDMVELKKLVVGIIQNGINASTFTENSPYISQLYREVDTPATAGIAEPSSTLTIHKPAQSDRNPDFQFTHDVEEVEEESLSLIERESDLIRKALKKHKGKRKLAAKELGISERTLYRKIKDLNLN